MSYDASKNNVFMKIYSHIYKFIKHVGYGLIWPIVLVVLGVSKLSIINRENKEKRIKEKSQKIINEEKKGRKKIDTTAYINKDVKIEKKNLGYYINTMLLAIIAVPKRIKKKFDNMSLVKQARNKKEFDTKAMLVDFSNEEDDTKGQRISWKYVAVDKNGKKKTGFFEAYSRLDVQSFLLGEGLVVYSIKPSTKLDYYLSTIGTQGKFKNKDLIFILAQLSTYLKSGIPLVDSLNILIRQVKKNSYKNILRTVTYDLTVGENFSVALEKRGNAFPKLLINMVKASELTGELPEALDDMVQYYTEVEETRKEMVSALTYPTIVFIFTLAVVTFVMVYVVPKFVDIYKSMDSSEIPSFTMLVMNISNYLQNNYVFLIVIILLTLISFIYLYKNVKVIKIFTQWILMHIPVVKDVIIYNEVTMFSKTFASLLSHNVYITDSMDILNRVTNNEIYKMMIMDTVSNLARGEKISTAFENQWAFPLPAYEMIVTGERTGQLAEMMAKVSTYYQSLHKSTVSRIKALVEPILIVFLTFAVGAILLAVIIPMFSMYSQVQNFG